MSTTSFLGTVDTGARCPDDQLWLQEHVSIFERFVFQKTDQHTAHAAANLVDGLPHGGQRRMGVRS
jgi:hypothetical protein